MVIAVACLPSEKKQMTFIVQDALLSSVQYKWKLDNPKPKVGCELSLLFSDNNKMLMNYRGNSFEGYYEIDSTLTNYITINIFNKLGWDEACDVNPEYLTLYDTDTQFSYTILNDKLYLQRAEKSIVFVRSKSKDSKDEVDQNQNQ